MTAPTVPPYAQGRADYGGRPDGTGQPVLGGRVTAVRPESPAWDAGLEPGMIVTRVGDEPLSDMVAWLWESDGDTVDLEVFDPTDGTTATCTLERLPGEDWGVDFDGAIFDGMRTCVNGCIFCFMTMLPAHMRGSLYIRDDDYRLSFLQGNFVTLTNLSDNDIERIISCQLSPMNVSIHAVSSDVRRRLMGKNAARGMEALEALMAAGIEIHAQVVLCPGVNDGAELDRTLAYVEAHPQITSLGIVPLGYTKFQKRFDRSFSDDPAAARAVVEQVRPFQERARARTGRTVYQLSDEFYLAAGVPVPGEAWYDGYPQFYDGIGMIRSYLEDTATLRRDGAGRLEVVAAALAAEDLSLMVVSGEAARETVAGFVEGAPLGGHVAAIENRYFGGNVNVTGLICAEDLLEQLPHDLVGVMLFLPEVMFNADGLTLDSYHREDLLDTLTRRGARAFVASTLPADLLDALEAALEMDSEHPAAR